jgi:hypothetical protein
LKDEDKVAVMWKLVFGRKVLQQIFY